MRERAPLRWRCMAGVDGDAARLELCLRAPAELVVRERREEEKRAGENHELNRGHRSATRRLFPRLAGEDDLARVRQRVHARELDELDMTDNRELHTSHLATGVRFMNRWRSQQSHRSSGSTRRTTARCLRFSGAAPGATEPTTSSR